MRSSSTMAKGVALGMIFGCAIGIILDNIGAWIAIGLAFGAGLGKRMEMKEKEKGSGSV